MDTVKIFRIIKKTIITIITIKIKTITFRIIKATTNLKIIKSLKRRTILKTIETRINLIRNGRIRKTITKNLIINVTI